MTPAIRRELTAEGLHFSVPNFMGKRTGRIIFAINYPGPSSNSKRSRHTNTAGQLIANATTGAATIHHRPMSYLQCELHNQVLGTAAGKIGLDLSTLDWSWVGCGGIGSIGKGFATFTAMEA